MVVPACGVGGSVDSWYPAKAVDGDDAVAMLPHTSLSAWGANIILLCWAYKTSRGGGMAKAEHQKASGEVLAAIVNDGLKSSGDTKLPIEIASVWEAVYPRPQVYRRSVDVKVSADGLVNMGCLLEDLRAASVGMPKGWWSHTILAAMASDLGHTPSLIALLDATSTYPRLRVLHVQLVWQLGLLVQAAWLASLNGQRSQ